MTSFLFSAGMCVKYGAFGWSFWKDYDDYDYMGYDYDYYDYCVLRFLRTCYTYGLHLWSIYFAL